MNQSKKSIGKHRFHEKIGKLIKDIIINYPEYKAFIAHNELGGGRFTLFSSPNQESSLKTRFCDVDILVVKDKEIKAVIEIEESNVKPNHIMGKYLASALSTHGKCEGNTYSMKESTIFIQIIDSNILPFGSVKPSQWDNIEEEISKVALKLDGIKSKYFLIYGNEKDFNPLGKAREKLESCFKHLSP